MTAQAGIDRKIAELAERAIEMHVFPGCQVGYIRGERMKVLPFGRFTYEPDSPKVDLKTVYDVASITKSIPTNSIIIKLVESGQLSLDEKAVTYLPEIQNEYLDSILV